MTRGQAGRARKARAPARMRNPPETAISIRKRAFLPYKVIVKSIISGLDFLKVLGQKAHRKKPTAKSPRQKAQG
jgi:hypothetical protein